MPELDERHERVEQLGQSRELVERGACLLEPWVVLEQHAAPLARELERLESASELRDGLGQVALASWCVILFAALTWNVNSGGVRSAQRPATSGSGSA